MSAMTLLLALAAAAQIIQPRPVDWPFDGTWIVSDLQLNQQRKAALPIAEGDAVAVGHMYLSFYSKAEMRKPIGKRFPYASILWSPNIQQSSFRLLGIEAVPIYAKIALDDPGVLTTSNDRKSIRLSFGDDHIDMVRTKAVWE